MAGALSLGSGSCCVRAIGNISISNSTPSPSLALTFCSARTEPANGGCHYEITSASTSQSGTQPLSLKAGGLIARAIITFTYICAQFEPSNCRQERTQLSCLQLESVWMVENFASSFRHLQLKDPNQQFELYLPNRVAVGLNRRGEKRRGEERRGEEKARLG